MVETFHCVHFGQMVNLHEILFSKGAKGYMYSLVGMGWGETLWKVYRYFTLCLFSDVS